MTPKLNYDKACGDDQFEGNPSKLFINHPLRIQEFPGGNVIDFYFPTYIDGDIEDYIDFLRAVRDAKSSDTIVLHINCYGGALSTAFNIIDVLNNSQATVEVCVEGACCSAASMIMLAGDRWEITEHSYVMIHSWSGGNYGKWHEQKASFLFDAKWLEKSFRKIYKNFLTEEELEAVIAGADMYFDCDETTERLNRYKEKDIKKQQMVQEIAQKHQDAINKEITEALANFDKENIEIEVTTKNTSSKSKKIKTSKREKK